MIVHGYTRDGNIEIEIDGAALTIPDDPANRHRQMIAAWEAEGHAIPSYVAPPPTAAETREASFRADTGRADLLTRLRTATPGQIDAWVDANVTTIAQARGVFKAILKLIALDART